VFIVTTSTLSGLLLLVCGGVLIYFCWVRPGKVPKATTNSSKGGAGKKSTSTVSTAWGEDGNTDKAAAVVVTNNAAAARIGLSPSNPLAAMSLTQPSGESGDIELTSVTPAAMRAVEQGALSNVQDWGAKSV